MQNGAKQRLIFLVVATRLPIGIWALWLATLATSLQVAFGGGAQPGQACEQWNLPIAGVAVQINRVQYFSLSALVREGRPIFVICTVHIVRLISYWEGEVDILRELNFLHAHNARWTYERCATEWKDTELVVLVRRLVSGSCYSLVIGPSRYIHSVS